jgi:hypothetical protein
MAGGRLPHGKEKSRQGRTFSQRVGPAPEAAGGLKGAEDIIASKPLPPGRRRTGAVDPRKEDAMRRIWLALLFLMAALAPFLVSA